MAHAPGGQCRPTQGGFGTGLAAAPPISMPTVGVASSAEERVAESFGRLELAPTASELPADVIVSILISARADDIAHAAAVCTHWWALVKVAVQRLVPGCTLRQFAAQEQMTLTVGASPPDRQWDAEWGPLLLEEFRLRGYPGPSPQDVALGEHSIEAMMRALVLPISWLKQAGWTAAQAEPATLLGFCGRAALGRALRERSPVYAASSHLLHGVLSAR